MTARRSSRFGRRATAMDDSAVRTLFFPNTTTSLSLPRSPPLPHHRAHPSTALPHSPLPHLRPRRAPPRVSKTKPPPPSAGWFVFESPNVPSTAARKATTGCSGASPPLTSILLGVANPRYSAGIEVVVVLTASTPQTSRAEPTRPAESGSAGAQIRPGNPDRLSTGLSDDPGYPNHVTLATPENGLFHGLCWN